jgi:PAS domain S-box-containing protein
MQARPMSLQEPDRDQTPSQWEKLERKENRLWLHSLLLLLILAGALAISAWGKLREVPQHFGAVPIGIVVLVALFGVYAWKEKREISELRGFVRGLQQGSSVPPTEKQIEQLLDLVSRSQHGYRDLIDSLDHVVFTISLDGGIQLVNRRFVEILSLPFPAVVHHPLEEFISEPTREEAEHGLARFLERRCWTGVMRVRLARTGEVRYFSCILNAVVREGQVTGISGLAADVTAQRESEARFTELFDTLQEGVYFSTPEGRLLEVNPALVRMLGYETKEEVLAIGAQDLYLDAAERKRHVAELGKLGVLREREITLKRKDGSPVRCLDSSTGVRDSSGRLVRFQGTLVDITQHLEIKKRLREEQEFVRRLIDSLPDAIVVLDTDGQYTYVSPRIRDLSGFEPEELIGKKLGERIYPDDLPAVEDVFHRLTAGESVSGQVEYRTLQKNGSWCTFRANASPLFDDKGKITGVVASARDVTESRRLEQQLYQTEKLVAMGQMIAGVAHELNNPLTAIIGISDLLCGAAKDERTRHQTDLIHQQARRAAQIVQSLLAFSRPASAQRAPVKFDQVIRRSLQLHEHSLQQDQITVQFDPSPDLPYVDADANQLMQVFLNLLTNAEQAILEIRDHGQIRIHVEHSGSKVSATVEDDGPGIKPGILAGIFDPFFTTKRPGGGTGLGLTICLSIVKEHGGTIEVQTSPLGGALFRVVLPAVEEATALQPGVQTKSNAASSHTLSGHSILLVDDESSIRELVQESLSARGLAVDCVASSEDALERLASHSYDVIVCDFNLPGLNGEQLFSRLHSVRGSDYQHFIFITGELLDPKTIESFTQRGARILQKPFQLSELAALLREVFDSVPSRAS